MLRFFDKDNRDITDDYPCCSNPACLGEPWCSAWGHCSEPEQEGSGNIPTMEGSGSELNEEDIDAIFSQLATLEQVGLS